MRLEAPEVHGELPSGLSGATKRKAATGLTKPEQKVCLTTWQTILRLLLQLASRKVQCKELF